MKKNLGTVVFALTLVLGVVSSSFAIQTIDATEAANLTQMREEEKLARDVYIEMYRLWGKKIFSNIIESEKKHMSAIKTLLDRYGLPDPIISDAPGAFTNGEIKTAYENFVARGSRSLEEALQVGVDVEKMDIADLHLFITQTDNTDVKKVYNNLYNGSLRHLGAFTYQLESLAP